MHVRSATSSALQHPDGGDVSYGGHAPAVGKLSCEWPAVCPAAVTCSLAIGVKMPHVRLAMHMKCLVHCQLLRA